MLRPAPVVDPRAIRGALALSYERMGRVLDVSSRTVERMEELGRPPRSVAVAERLGSGAHRRVRRAREKQMLRPLQGPGPRSADHQRGGQGTACFSWQSHHSVVLTWLVTVTNTRQ